MWFRGSLLLLKLVVKKKKPPACFTGPRISIDVAFFLQRSKKATRAEAKMKMDAVKAGKDRIVRPRLLA